MISPSHSEVYLTAHPNWPRFGIGIGFGLRPQVGGGKEKVLSPFVFNCIGGEIIKSN